MPDIETKNLAIALKGKKILECTDEEIKEGIRYAMLLVGMRANSINKIGDVEKSVTLAFIRRHYSGHTLTEFKMAFDKAVAGELSIDSREVNAYENFSCAYIGKIMNAYRAWSSDAYKFAKMDTVEPKMVEFKYDTTNPLSTVQMYYDDFLDDNLNIDHIFGFAWERVVKELGVKLSNKEMKEIVIKARGMVLNYYANEKPTNDIQNRQAALKKLPVLESCEDTYVDRKSKALALMQFFSQLRELEVTNIIEHFKKD